MNVMLMVSTLQVNDGVPDLETANGVAGLEIVSLGSNLIMKIHI